MKSTVYIRQVAVMNKFLIWMVFNVPLGRLAPYVLGWACGCKGVKVGGDDD